LVPKHAREHFAFKQLGNSDPWTLTLIAQKKRTGIQDLQRTLTILLQLSFLNIFRVSNFVSMISSRRIVATNIQADIIPSCSINFLKSRKTRNFASSTSSSSSSNTSSSADLLQRHFGFPNISWLQQAPSLFQQDVEWGSMDSFGHVNNVVYYRWFENGRFDYFVRLKAAIARLYGADAGRKIYQNFMSSRAIGPILHSSSCRFRSVRQTGHSPTSTWLLILNPSFS
jgi:hypothetical protein